MHGSCLPKNANLANWLITKAIETKTNLEQVKYTINYSLIDDRIANTTQSNLIKRFLV